MCLLCSRMDMEYMGIKCACIRICVFILFYFDINNNNSTTTIKMLTLFFNFTFRQHTWNFELKVCIRWTVSHTRHTFNVSIIIIKKRRVQQKTLNVSVQLRVKKRREMTTINKNKIETHLPTSSFDRNIQPTQRQR